MHRVKAGETPLFPLSALGQALVLGDEHIHKAVVLLDGDGVLEHRLAADTHFKALKVLQPAVVVAAAKAQPVAPAVIAHRGDQSQVLMEKEQKNSISKA